MIQLTILFGFFGLLIVGAVVSSMRGELPTAAQLEAEDRARDARIQDSLDSAD